MKKLFFLLAAAAMLALATSCKEQAGILYSVTADGNCNGKVELTFPDGAFNGNGTAAIDFKWSNDTTKAFTAPCLSLKDALKCNDAKTLQAAKAIDEWANSFSATAAEGDYYIHIAGYAKETLTGITLSIDKTFTNKQ